MKFLKLGIVGISLLALASCSNNASEDMNDSSSTVESEEEINKETNEGTNEEVNEESKLLSVEELINENSEAIYDYAMYLAANNSWEYDNSYISIDYDDIKSNIITSFSFRHVSFRDDGYAQLDFMQIRSKFTSNNIFNKTRPTTGASTSSNTNIITHDDSEFKNLAEVVYKKLGLNKADYLTSIVQTSSNDIVVYFYTKYDIIAYRIENTRGLNEDEIIKGINNNTLELEHYYTTNCGKYYIEGKAN